MSYETDRLRSELRDKADRHELTNLENKVSSSISRANEVSRKCDNVRNDLEEQMRRRFEEMEERLAALEKPRGEDGN
jgi:DNA anti-recombination protein RmuC